MRHERETCWQHVFEPFFTTEESRAEGTGLGMATVYGIVKQNAEATSRSRAKSGSAHRRGHLPAHALGRSATEEAVSAVEAQPGGKEVLLVVEDEARLLRLNTRVLAGLGYKVLSAESAAEALRVAEAYTGEIALLVTDVAMPEMTGWELARRLVAFAAASQGLALRLRARGRRDRPEGRAEAWGELPAETVVT